MSDNYRESAIKKRSKEIMPKIKLRILRAITLQEAKKRFFFPYFGRTNIIFTDYTTLLTIVVENRDIEGGKIKRPVLFNELVNCNCNWLFQVSAF